MTPSTSRRRVPTRLGTLVPRGRSAAASLALVTSALVAGPASGASAAESATLERTVVVASASTELRDAESALGARLALGYAGAVPAADVEALVREVSRQLHESASPSDQLLQTTEAVSRRALTDFLTRGTPLPIG
ncbi:MAG: hypothetical protein WBL35_12440 [Ornithinibacter sp.]